MAALLIGGLSFAGIFMPSAALADHAGAIGIWFTEGGKSKVEIYDCAGKLCGKIIWLKEPLNDAGQEKLDINNQDEAMRARKILGLDMLSAFVPEQYEDHAWTDGEIYNPEDGETYSCNMELFDDGRLKVRGYVGLPMFGKTQIWTPGG
jgi:uncharacterized protein (DUF2147 family)